MPPLVHAVLVITLSICLFPHLVQAETQNSTLRLAVLKFGTASWEANVIKHHKLDKKYGFTLDIVPLASKQASVIALQGSGADMILADWVWVSRQRNAGHLLTFFPYSRCVGGIVVPADSPIKNLADLAGHTLGIAGGPIDRNWLMIRALTKQQFDIDLDQSIEKVFGAPPLLYKKTLNGELDGVINFWHYLAKLEATGMRRLITMEEVVEQLGASNDTPMLGYVFHQHWAEKNPELVSGMMAASANAKQILKTSDAEWQRLRPLIKPETDAEFFSLRDHFRHGIPTAQQVTNTKSAELLYRILAQSIPRSAPTLAEGTFYIPPAEPVTNQSME